MISFLVAMNRDHIIGKDNKMPWHLPNDLKYFKERTLGNPTIMGRKTYDSIGKPLPNRPNIVITRNSDLSFPDEVEVIDNLEIIKEWNKQNPEKEYFVIGGGIIFEKMLAVADRLYITWIDESFEGDTFFPKFSLEEWELTSKEKGVKNENNPYDYYYLVYDRKRI